MNRVIFGDCRDTMRDLKAQGVRVQCCVTSPPYFGLRDYGHPGQIGLEKTPAEYVAALVEVFEGVRELLADDGVLWLNLGDSYYGAGQRGDQFGTKAPQPKWAEKSNAERGHKRGTASPTHGLKFKDLSGMPWRVAMALQQPHLRCAACDQYSHSLRWMAVPPQFCDFEEGVSVCPECGHCAAPAATRNGWYLRQDIIWHKPNPMPESVTDRCTKAHEYLFLLTKSERYFWDAEAMKEDATGALPGNLNHKHTAEYEDSGDEKHRTKAGLIAYAERQRSKRDSFKREDSKRAEAIPGQTVGTHRADRDESEYDTGRRNRRSVWTVPTQPYAGAHFAVFPAALIEPCVLAGSRPGDVVLDPFMGSGTTAQVAQALGRQWIGCELNTEYAPLQQARTVQAAFAI